MAHKPPAVSRPSQLVAQQVRRARKRRGWSAQRLAEELQGVGLPWDRTIIANLENGRRNAVSVEELLALSYVLAVPPVLMLVPLGEADTVNITPDLAVPPGLAHRWVLGDVPPVDDDRYVKDWRQASRPLYLYCHLRDAGYGAEAAHDAVTYAEYVGDPQEVRCARLHYVMALRALIEALEAIMGADLKPPPLDRKWREDAERAGLSWPDGAPVSAASATPDGGEE